MLLTYQIAVFHASSSYDLSFLKYRQGRMSGGFFMSHNPQKYSDLSSKLHKPFTWHKLELHFQGAMHDPPPPPPPPPPLPPPPQEVTIRGLQTSAIPALPTSFHQAVIMLL